MSSRVVDFRVVESEVGVLLLDDAGKREAARAVAGIGDDNRILYSTRQAREVEALERIQRRARRRVVP
jgi:hypothetical protein